MPALEEQTIAVTGGGSGLGLALVRRFTTEGAQVGSLERSTEKAAALRRAFPGVLVVEGDATQPAVNRTLVDSMLERFGRLDCLVANVGIWDFNMRFADMELDALDAGFDELFAVNVKSALLGCRAALDALAAARGSIIITLSNAAFYPGGGGALYTASKHALVGVVRQLAYELAPVVRVNGIAPGVLPSDLRGPVALRQADRTIMGELPSGEGLRTYTLMEHEVTAESYVGAYVLLASRMASPTATGTIIDLSGVGVRGRRDRELARARAVMGAP